MSIMRHSTRGGFWLVELIVVFGIVVILIAILLPTVIAIHRRSTVTLCASNLRQIGQAMFMYRAASRDWPSATPIPVLFAEPGEVAAPTLNEVLLPYLSLDSAVYHCPGDDQQVFQRCALVPGGHGISYYFWPPHRMPKQLQSSSQSVLNDFQGSGRRVKTVTVSQFHPPHMGMNDLMLDGSVQFGFVNPAGP